MCGIIRPLPRSLLSAVLHAVPCDSARFNNVVALRGRNIRRCNDRKDPAWAATCPHMLSLLLPSRQHHASVHHLRPAEPQRRDHKTTTTRRVIANGRAALHKGGPNLIGHDERCLRSDMSKKSADVDSNLRSCSSSVGRAEECGFATAATIMTTLVVMCRLLSSSV